jgi:cobalt/nickel transport system permease protein
MHISDGVLSGPVLAAGWAGAAVLAVATTRKMDMEEVPKLAVIAGVFFVGSLIRFPIGAASVHLILNGLVGVILGIRAFPAILLGITLQAILFGHGGVSVIGVNSCMMGGGALVAYGVWQLRNVVSFPKREVIFGGLAGAGGVFVSGCVLALVMVTTGDAFWGVAKTVLYIHVGIMIFEGLVVAGCVSFLMKVRPDMLAGWKRGGSTKAAVPPVAFWAALALAVTFLVPTTAHAHKLLIDYTPVKEGLLIEAFFPDGKPALNTTMRLMTEDGRVVAKGMTNEHGGHLFAVPERVNYVADADAQMGHYVKMEIPASALADVELGATLTEDAADIEKTVTKVHKEPLPLGKVIIGFAILAVLGGAAFAASKRKRHAA